VSHASHRRILSLNALAPLVDGVVEGDGTVCVGSVTGVEEASADSLVRVDHLRYLDAALSGPGVALLVGPSVPANTKPVLRVANPRLAFAMCAEAVAGDDRPPPGIHPTAVVGEGVCLGDDVTIMARSVVGAGSRIGSRVVLYPNVTVGNEVRLGDDTILYPAVTLYDGVEVGCRVRIHSGTVIGSDGFGYEWDGQLHRKIPHVGSVRIGDDVEIGANVAVDRATTGWTEIGSGSKIDNLVQIAHNVQIGPNCLIVAQAGLAGSSRLGAGVVIGGQSAVRDHVEMGDGAQLAGKSGVWSDLSAGGRYSGNPARSHREEQRSLLAYQRLPGLLRRVAALERLASELRKLHPEDGGDETGSGVRE